jgi:ankyrin repeat protein
MNTTNVSNNLISAASHNNTNEVIASISYGGNINCQDVNGITPLMFAVIYGNLELLLYLLQLNANIDIQNHKKQTALMLSIEYGHPDIMMILINSQASLTIRDVNNLRAIDYYRSSTNPVIRNRNVPVFSLVINNI